MQFTCPGPWTQPELAAAVPPIGRLCSECVVGLAAVRRTNTNFRVQVRGLQSQVLDFLPLVESRFLDLSLITITAGRAGVQASGLSGLN